MPLKLFLQKKICILRHSLFIANFLKLNTKDLRKLVIKEFVINIYSKIKLIPVEVIYLYNMEMLNILEHFRS